MTETALYKLLWESDGKVYSETKLLNPLQVQFLQAIEKIHGINGQPDQRLLLLEKVV